MGVNNRRPKMKLDLLFFLQGISLIQGTCDSGNRDCNCVDSSFAECSESAHPDSFHVDSLEECIFQCNLFVQFEGCDYLIYTGDSGEDENCHLHQGDFTFQDYFNTCSMSGQPVFNDQDNCFANSQDECPSEACQGDCQQCGIDSPDDQDCWGVRESDCSMTTAGHKIPREVESRDECQQLCTEDEVKQGHGYTYFTWNKKRMFLLHLRGKRMFNAGHCPGHPNGDSRSLLRWKKTTKTNTNNTRTNNHNYNQNYNNNNNNNNNNNYNKNNDTINSYNNQ